MGMSTQARSRSRELRQAELEAARRQARHRRILVRAGVLVIIGLVVAIVVAVLNAVGGNDSPPASTGEVVAPAHVTSGALALGDQEAPVALEIYYDYMCPACGAFEAANGAELDRLLEDGVVRIELRPISFLDGASNGTLYSTRAANAFATVADAAPATAWAFHTALYAGQPSEGSAGLSDEQIADIAVAAGVPVEVVARFTDDTYEPWVASVTQQAFAAGVTQTPTVKIDGTVFDGDKYSVGPLTAAIETAAGAP